MERWVTAIKEFISEKEGTKTMAVLAISYWVARVLLNVAQTEIINDTNVNLVSFAVAVMGTLSGFLVGRFDPYRRTMFKTKEYRIIWSAYCIGILFLVWLAIRFRSIMSM